MKRWLLLTLIGISIGFSSTSEAQKKRASAKAHATIDVVAYNDLDGDGFDYRRPYNNRSEYRRSAYFKRTSNQFIFALQNENIRRARILKQDLLAEMRIEIRATRQQLRQEKRRVANRVDNRRRNAYRRYEGEIYSKRRISRGNLIFLERKLRQQEDILWDLENTRLNRRNRSIVIHRRLVRQFARSINA